MILIILIVIMSILLYAFIGTVVANAAAARWRNKIGNPEYKMDGEDMMQGVLWPLTVVVFFCILLFKAFMVLASKPSQVAAKMGCWIGRWFK